MSMTNRPARLGFVAALFALLLGPLVLGAQSALAQGPTQSTYYGGGHAGMTISASIGDEACDSFDAGADGQWVIRIDEGDCNGAAQEGATVSFAIGDDAAAETVTWAPGDAQEVTLTVAPPEPDDGMEDPDNGMEDPDNGMEDPDDGMEDPDDGMKTPETPVVGNGGFATGSGSTSPLLALALGVLALAGVAGARTVTGRVS